MPSVQSIFLRRLSRLLKARMDSIRTPDDWRKMN